MKKLLKEIGKFLIMMFATIAVFCFIAKVVNHNLWSPIIIIVGLALCASEYIVFDKDRGGNWDD